MITDHLQNVAKLHEYAHQVKEKVYNEASRNGEAAYEDRLNETIQHLQDQIKQHQVDLEELLKKSSPLSTDEPSQDPRSRLHQIRVVTMAYKALAISEPVLPSLNSPLPALIALRSTHNCINETKASLMNTTEKISKLRNETTQEDQYMRDQQVLSDILEQRTKRLQFEQISQNNLSIDELSRRIILDQQKQKGHYRKELRNLMKAFNKFVKEHLASMLAAEELGGPIVGDLSDIDEETLKTGFSRQGKARKLATGHPSSEAERQRRIDHLWGPLNENEELETSQRTERNAAGSAFRLLCEDLLNAAAGDTASNPYVNINRETAAVRFLVRSKIAQFHPQDARKLRLVDFGQELSG